MRRKNNIIVVICVFIICVSAYMGHAKVMGPQTIETSNKDYNEVVQNSQDKVLDKEEALKYLEENQRKVRKKNDIYDDIHRMANTLILAEDGKVWGRDNITDEKCNTLIIEVIASDFNDKDRLLSILNRWKEEDFSQGVEDHNYVWNKLGGTVGRASELKDEFK